MKIQVVTGKYSHDQEWVKAISPRAVAPTMGARALAREAFLGTPLRIVTGEAAEVALTDRGDGGGRERLIHGSFTFGLANYTAMLAVNHPFVLPGVSECRFLDPVKVGESMTPLAVTGDKGKVEI